MRCLRNAGGAFCVFFGMRVGWDASGSGSSRGDRFGSPAPGESRWCGALQNSQDRSFPGWARAATLDAWHRDVSLGWTVRAQYPRASGYSWRVGSLGSGSRCSRKGTAQRASLRRCRSRCTLRCWHRAAARQRWRMRRRSRCIRTRRRRTPPRSTFLVQLSFTFARHRASTLRPSCERAWRISPAPTRQSQTALRVAHRSPPHSREKVGRVLADRRSGSGRGERPW